MTLRIATWNINSIRIRLEALAMLASQYTPDIICLQETKVEDNSFPMLDVRALGYDYIHISGEKSYNGVALLSKLPLMQVHTESFAGLTHKRHIAATLPGGEELHNFYVPAGGDIPDPTLNQKFDEKLRFMRDLATWAKARKNKKIIMVGDMNIAPLPNDVWSHKQLLKIVSHTPIEVELMEALRDTLGWVDTARHFTPDTEKLYSWWSYRNRDWEKSDRGRRLDHIWVTPPIKASLASSVTIKPARNWPSPSDHVPVVTEFA